MKIAGFVIYGHDNQSYAFADHPSHLRCACGLYIDKWKQLPVNFRLCRRSLDVSATFDGATIVSERFRHLYQNSRWSGLEFRDLPSEPGFFQIVASAVIVFDSVTRGTRFLDLCTICGRFRSVAGATPVFLGVPGAIPSNSFVRTDVEFGTGAEMHPLIICGAETGQTLKMAGLRGLDLEPIKE